MKGIISPIQSVADICGKQRIRQDVEYRPSRFCIEIACDDGALLYNTLTGELVLCEKQENPGRCRDELIKKWFLIPKDYDEKRNAFVVNRIASMLARPKSHKTTFTVLTTTDCNARCYYCYEIGRERIAMTERTATAVTDHIVKVCGGNAVKIVWFGGEPLYNMRVIDVITEKLAEENVTFRTSMTSNGFFLTPEVSRKAKCAWNLDSVQITIDGTESVYNRVKAYIETSDNPFVRVMNNIENALDVGIRIKIRLNIDRGNAEDMVDALAQIGQRFGGRSNCHISLALLKSYRSKIREFMTVEDALECYLTLRETAERYGLVSPKPLPREYRINCCKADNDSCEVILPDGRIEKCNHYCENEHIGSVFREQKDDSLIASWKERVSFPECDACALLPMCRKLKKCERNMNGCSEVDRRIIRYEIEKQMKYEYTFWKANKNSNYVNL